MQVVVEAGEKGEKNVKKRYVKNNSITKLGWKKCNSPIWNDLLKVKEIYLRGRTLKVRNGKQADF